MKNLVIALSISFSSAAFANHCAKYEGQKEFMTAIQVVAKEMNYTFNQLCSQTRIGDIYVANRMFYTREGDPVPHTWVNLHYWTYTCQYFVRKSDNVITQSNCYNAD